MPHSPPHSCGRRSRDCSNKEIGIGSESSTDIRTGIGSRININADIGTDSDAAIDAAIDAASGTDINTASDCTTASVPTSALLS